MESKLVSPYVAISPNFLSDLLDEMNAVRCNLMPVPGKLS